ncbi:MAG: hypothetical protein K8F91_01240, partial [Candidatus Obscuribacterales bacterium]|nr:hypothetical protein [Candidatus Obscuribacterales bacterium]
KPSANAFEATAVPSVHGVASGNNLKPGFYAATDGITTLNVAENGEAVLVTGGASKVVSVNKIGAEVYATDKTSKAVFRYSDHALIDEQGTKLFKAGAPELSTVQVIKNVAVTLNRYYQAYGHYPQTQTELQSLEQHIAYMNPLNDRPAFPRLMTVIERRGSSSMTLDEYSNANLITSKLMNLNGSMGEPCGVELYVTPYSSTGETVVIRGYDRSGSLLPCSLAGRCYNLVLVAGSVR